MRTTWARTIVRAGALAAGPLLFAGTAYATGPDAPGTPGTAAVTAIRAPIVLCGGHLGLGPNQAECGQAPAPGYAELGLDSLHNDGLLDGDQVSAPVQVPVRICGIAISVTGPAQAACDGGN